MPWDGGPQLFPVLDSEVVIVIGEPAVAPTVSTSAPQVLVDGALLVSPE
jgi:hypothetical protein